MAGGARCVFVVVGCLLVGTLAGGLMYRYRIPPVGVGLLDLGILYSGEPRACDKREKMAFYNDLPRATAPRLTFFGDSVAEGVYDSRVIGANAVDIGFSGLTVRCALEDFSTISKLSSERMIIYLGGNDADDFLVDGRPLLRLQRSLYPDDPAVAANQIADLYEIFVTKLMAAGIEPIIHGIHLGGPWRRSRPFLEVFNRRLREIADARSLIFIPPVDVLSFATLDDVGRSTLSFDGEHLRYDGYVVWRDHIRQFVRDF